VREATAEVSQEISRRSPRSKAQPFERTTLNLIANTSVPIKVSADKSVQLHFLIALDRRLGATFALQVIKTQRGPHAPLVMYLPG